MEREEKKIDCLWCCFLCKNRTQAAADGPYSCHIGCRMHRTWASVPTEHGHHRLMLKLSTECEPVQSCNPGGK
ncbi:hypothetical protein GUJ93_ZPchr0006g44695 [Zizania palustris]|uniref:Uncharacterized protein n=1 Tax=Zizania palustris TaxID=103762 RepID=A0A8J5VJX3_ZIZPA|nr:hypothetical protein GUJ93_ZPchr0006g44695 [Zizania palustris]